MKNILKRSLLLLISTLVALLIAEGISRLLPWQSVPPILIYDSKIHFRLRPGMSGTWTIENNGHFTINSYGFRDVEWKLRKDKKYRVAVLGDSFVEALQVDLEQSFPKLIESSLGNVEVMNFGISGQGQVEELLTYRHYVRTFKPDLVVLCVFPGNDFEENWNRRMPTLRSPVYIKTSSNGVEVIPTPGVERIERLRTIIDWVHYHSSLMQRFKDLFRRKDPRLIGDLNEVGLWDGFFGNPKGIVRDFDGKWELTEKLLLQLYNDVTSDVKRSDGFLVVCLTEGVQVHKIQREAFIKQHPGLDPDYSENRLRAFCESNGIPFLGISKDMIYYNTSTNKLLHGFDERGHGHFNIDGHRIAAESISRRLKDMLP